MIERRVLLILGAGASADFSFPSGETLVEIICNNLNPEVSVWSGILGGLGFSSEMIEAYKYDLFHSNRFSVDAFLEHRPEFVQIGKASIALSLIPSENEQSLFGTSLRPKNWYRYLYNKMATESFKDFQNNQISIITFNYDRSIEHFFFTSIKSDYGKTESECAALLEHLPLVHVHGSLGSLPWQSKEGRSYSPDLTVQTVEAAMNGIKIISEAADDSPELDIARELIRNAEMIYFLGFGYHPTNLRRLHPELFQGKAVLGTAFKLGDSGRTELGKRCSFLRLEQSDHNVMSFVENVAQLG
jgi:hypothetical protein